MGCRKAIYESLKELLGGKFPNISYIALQRQQMKQAKEEWPIPLPALLVEIPTINWRDVTNNELGEVTIRIYLYQDMVGDAYKGSENETADLTLLDMQDKVMEALSGFTANGLLSGLIRRADDIESYGKRYVCLRSEFVSSVLQKKPEGDRCTIVKLNVESNGN